MKQLTVIETAEELVKAADPVRGSDDTTPYLGDGKLIFENDMKSVRLESEGFSLSGDVTVDDVIVAIAQAANLNVHIT